MPDQNDTALAADSQPAPATLPETRAERAALAEQTIASCIAGKPAVLSSPSDSRYEIFTVQVHDYDSHRMNAKIVEALINAGWADQKPEQPVLLAGGLVGLTFIVPVED